MKKSFLLICSLFICLSSYCQSVSLEDFQKEIDNYKLKFEMPDGYKVTDIKKNTELQYSFAIINEDKSVEIRYSLIPLKEMLEKYEISKNNPNLVVTNPNTYYQAMMVSNGMNMTNGKMPKINDYPPHFIKRDYNADKGGLSFFKFNCEFGKGYKYGQVVYLHKENNIDVIITFMSNVRHSHRDLTEKVFSALSFK